MNQELTHTPPQTSSVSLHQRESLIREQFGLQEATTTEIEYFFAVAERLGLDPISRQIYAIMRNDRRANRKVMTVQVGIDGLRLAASRTGAYAGQDETVFGPCFEGTQYPATATKTVYRITQGVRCPFTASVRWAEFAQTTGQWPKMPFVMLGKVAEAAALRMAFPAELGGVYIAEEMAQADVQDAEPVPLTDEQQAHLMELSDRAGVAEPVAKRRVKAMTASDYAKAVSTLEQRIIEQGAAHAEAATNQQIDEDDAAAAHAEAVDAEVIA